MTKISVLMPVYKTPVPYLQEAIESILNQTFTDFEFLILDDCPEDNRKDVVLSYHDKRIKYIQNERNLGISESRNKLIEMASGEYLAIFDHDDISVPERLEKEVAYLDSHPEIGVISGNMVAMSNQKQSHYPTENIDIKKKLLKGCFVVHTAAMIRKSVLLENHIRYESAYSPAEDYMLWIRLIGKTMFHNLPDVLVYYRDFEGNTTHTQYDKMVDRDGLIKCFAYNEYPYLIPNILNTTYKKTISLFGLLPLLRINHKQSIMFVLLFGFIPLFKIKSKEK